ncbi:hypothetical protein [Prosthecobacter sp.]|uniref:hypothetical protein n=1 Tax=Prosthecobacter sp. TaxID=1965333 RepID=UPI0037836B8D
MDAPKYFHQEEAHAVFRPAGELTLAEVVGMVAEAISFAHETGVGRLMVVLTEVTGIPSPKLTARYQFVREWAKASEGRVRVAVVTTAEMIDPGRFCVTVATNAGLEADVFVDEAKALEWLVGAVGMMLAE